MLVLDLLRDAKRIIEEMSHTSDTLMAEGHGATAALAQAAAASFATGAALIADLTDLTISKDRAAYLARLDHSIYGAEMTLLTMRGVAASLRGDNARASDLFDMVIMSESR